MTSPRRFGELLLLGALHAITAVTVASASDEPQADAVQRLDVAQLISELGSNDYDRRESAEKQLWSLGLESLDQFARAYRLTDDFDVRLRIQRIVVQLYFWEKLPDAPGFLGVSASSGNRLPDWKRDSRIAKGKAAYDIGYIVPNSSADLCGLRERDLIVSLDGVTLDAGAIHNDFAALIQGRRAGTIIVIEFYRGRELHAIRLPLSIGSENRGLQFGPGDPGRTSTYARVFNALPAWWRRHFATERDDVGAADRLPPR
jgi:PDZ domain